MREFEFPVMAQISDIGGIVHMKSHDPSRGRLQVNGYKPNQR